MTVPRSLLLKLADNALAPGPPTHAREAAYTAMWLGTSVTAWALLKAGRALSRERP